MSEPNPSGTAGAPARRGLLPLLVVLATNAVPLYGIWRHGWGSATTLALYWCENVIGAAFVTLRLVLHRSFTHDDGYQHNQLGISSGGQGKASHPIAHFIPEFATGAFVFSLAHALFLVFVLGVFLPGAGAAPVDFSALAKGVAAICAVNTIGFLLDLPKLRQRPFAWAKDMAQRTMSRVIVVHLTIIFGMFAFAWLHKPEAFLFVFASLKLLLDIGSSWPRREISDRPPAWLRGVARVAGKDPQAVWDKTRRDLAPTLEDGDAGEGRTPPPAGAGAVRPASARRRNRGA